MNSFSSLVERLPEGHPVKVYFEESILVERILSELGKAETLSAFQRYLGLFDQLSAIEKRFARKENQLFPYLEKYGWHAPSRGMWMFHDRLRNHLRRIKYYNAERNTERIKEILPYLLERIRRLLAIEEGKLFPEAMKLLTEDDWKEVYAGDEEIGWMLPRTPPAYPSAAGGYIHPSRDFAEREVPFLQKDTSHFDEGYLSPDQVDLLLRFLPVDITYVDENDRVMYYNRGGERVFPRSKGIIGREVRYCHPPKSVGTVLRILEEFRAGSKDLAEFWLEVKGRMIYIRYFAVRDEEKNYRGVLEISQDITDIQKLNGEKRLLGWDES